MRVEAMTVPDGIVIRIGNEVSVSLSVDEIKGKGLQEVGLILCDKIESAFKLRERDDGEPEVFELLGNEDDEDLSIFEEVIEIDW